MFLDDTYFQGELYIPNVKRDSSFGVSSVLQAVGEHTLDWYIAKYEKRCLIELMGEEMYLKFIQGVEDEDNDWMALRDNIFVEEDRFKYSLVANYVYFYAMRDMQTQTSPKGEVRGRMDDATTVSAYQKLVRIWNNMVDMSVYVTRFICKNQDKYGEICNCGNWDYINAFGI